MGRFRRTPIALCRPEREQSDHISYTLRKKPPIDAKKERPVKQLNYQWDAATKFTNAMSARGNGGTWEIGRILSPTFPPQVGF